ncbi:MAG: translocation/assembly module TamB domain-containing protein, partial [Bryobacterales bacterium]|nr:translocation/assembly module TamB domain-containing protein [Bryobacterales bacterium]
GRDHIDLTNAVIATAASKIQVTGTVDHLVSPNVSGRAEGQIDLAEVKRSFGLPVQLNTANNVPRVLHLDAALNTEAEGGKISSARLSLGESSLDVLGTFRDLAALQGTVQFNSNLALSELARVFELPFQAGGAVRMAGDAVLNGASNYAVDADLIGRNLEYRSGDVRLMNVAVRSRIAADPHIIRVNPIQAEWLGGNLNARATLQEFARYRLDGTLNGFDLERLAELFASKRIGYAGAISGNVEAQGNIKSAASGLEIAHARIAIAPKPGGVPVRGQIDANYNGLAGTVDLGQSFIALPSSRVDLNGAIDKQLTVHFVSRNLDDFRPVIPDIPVRFDTGGSAVADAVVVGKLSMPVITGHATVSRFAVEQRHFDLLAADVFAQSNGANLRNGTLTHGALNAQFQGSVGLDRWQTTPSAPLSAVLAVRNADLMDVLALAGQADIPARGALTLSANASGTLGNPQGSADILVVNGAAYGQPIDRLNGRVNFGGRTVAIPAMQLTSGTSRVDLNGAFQHPQNDFSTGTLHAHVSATQVTLSRVEPLHQRRPDLDGDIQLNMDADAVLEPPAAAERFRLVAANGSVGARNLRLEGDNFGNAAATIQTRGTIVSFRLDSDFAGSSIRADGRTDLNANYQTVANLNIRDLPVEKALKAARQESIPARGVFSANGQVAGTLREPTANLDVSLAKATISNQPIDLAQGHIDYSNTLVNVPSFSVQAGPNRLTASGSFMHPSQDFSTGNVKLRLDSNTLQLAQVKYLQQLLPGLGGSAQVNVDGAATLNSSNTEPRVMLSMLNAKVLANGIRANGKDLGGLTATAEQSGAAVHVNLDSNLAQSKIHLNGQAQLTRNYPLSAQLTFENVRYSNLSGLLAGAKGTPALDFDALVEGRADVNGPAMSPADLTGSAQISKLEITTRQAAALRAGTNLVLHNDGPISVVANQGGVQVQQARLVGPSTEIALTGNMALRPAAAFNLNVNGNVDLALIQQIDRSTSASGTVALRAAIAGSPSKPVVNGRLDLKNAAYQQIDWPNGISNANGAIVFTGSAARIESLTAESGGGKITATGNVIRTASGFAFNLQSRATRVLVRTDVGASITANADVRLNGTDQSSVLGGDITIVGVNFNPQSDVASLLLRTSAPAETPGAPEGLLANMRLAIAIRMAPGAVLQSSYTQGLQAQADVMIRGTLLSPGMIGRVNLTAGSLVFFGTKYTINEGSVSFYNPYKIQPVLDLNLETTVQSVNVVLTVSGPVENMKLSYHSDPPLQFSEIVALLGAGKTPTSDPVLLANQPTIPQQSVTDMGASALLGAAVANPVAGQLQRVFGVSQIKIAPTFVSGSTIPQAQVTLQQQISQNILFTYVTDLTQP